jgi:hypothetical protein
MILIYTDESGTNYDIQNNFFKDGPFIIWGGMCVDDTKYFHLERMFIQLIDSFFGIGDWLKQEIHGTDIWNRQGFFSAFSESTIRDFFEELLQLLCKLHTCCLFGMRLKSPDADADRKRLETAKAIYAFLHNTEYHLAKEKETGLIIADVIDFKSNIEGSESRQRSILDRLLYDRMTWRINPKTQVEPLISSKYKFESQTCFLLDDIHYVQSKHSLFLQISDVVIYTIMRVFTYLYLLANPGLVEADILKVPISTETFTFFVGNNVTFAFFEDASNDVRILKGSDFVARSKPSEFANLSAFRSTVLRGME